MARKRRRKSGDLAQLRAVLWGTIIEVEPLLDARPPPSDLTLKSAHALSQLSMAYQRLVEALDFEKRLTALEARLNGGSRDPSRATHR